MDPTILGLSKWLEEEQYNHAQFSEVPYSRKFLDGANISMKPGNTKLKILTYKISCKILEVSNFERAILTCDEGMALYRISSLQTAFQIPVDLCLHLVDRSMRRDYLDKEHVDLYYSLCYSKDVLRMDRFTANPLLADQSNFLHPVVYFWKNPPTPGMYMLVW